MIIEIDKNQVNVNLIIFDTVSFQAWGKKDGKMVINIPADEIKRIVIETKNE